MDDTGSGLPTPARHGQNERAIALGRKSWLFAGSDRGADRAAVMATLIVAGQAQRRLSSGLARRRARPHRRASCSKTRRTAPVELAEDSRSQKGRSLIVKG